MLLHVWARRARYRWRARAAVSDTIGAATGFVALATLVAGLLGLGDALQAHTTLSRAVNTAVQSEAQFGCWTAVTSEAVAQTLQGGGVSPAQVQVPTYTSEPATYGNPVAAKLAAAIHLPVIGAVPLTVQAGAPSQASGAAVPACTAPNLANPPQHAVDTNPQLQSISANPMVPGEQVTLQGAHLGTSGSLTLTDGAYSWGSAQMTVSGWASDQITFTVPSNAPATSGSAYASLTVTANGLTSAPFLVSIA